MNETEPHGTTPEVGSKSKVQIETIIRRPDGTIREHTIEEDGVERSVI
jgi:hypothetical protein